MNVTDVHAVRIRDVRTMATERAVRMVVLTDIMERVALLPV